MGTLAKVRARIEGQQEAVAFFAPAFRGMKRESLRVAHLDRERRLIGVRLFYSNLCDSVAFPLRTIIHDALELGTAGLLVAHNHPSGDPTPSRDDLVATRALAALARPLGIKLHDHLIFAEGRSRSLYAMGLL